MKQKLIKQWEVEAPWSIVIFAQDHVAVSDKQAIDSANWIPELMLLTIRQSNK